VSAAQLLAKIEARNPLSRIIYVIWDNAAYHKGPDVREFLKRPDCRIRLIQLPPYCPHLNPIERLWAVMHQYVTHNHYYPTQKQFADLSNEWQTFRDQVSDNFRVVIHEKCRIMR
jgi:transposase